MAELLDTAAPTRPSRWQQATRWLGKWFRTHPITLVLAVAMVVCTMLAASGTWDGLSSASVFRDGHWWTLWTYGFAAHHRVQLCFALIALLVTGTIFEPRMRAWVFLVAALVVPVFGGVVAIGLQSVGGLIGVFGKNEAVTFVDPFAISVALVAVGSATLTPPVKRRTRVLLVMLMLLMTLYVGHLAHIANLGTVIAGLAFGALAIRREHREHWRRSTAHETRILLAGTMGVLGLGPILGLIVPLNSAIAAPLAGLARESAIWHCLLTTTSSCFLENAESTGLSFWQVLASALPWCLWFVVAWGIWRGKRLAIDAGIVICLGISALVSFYWFVVPAVLVDADSADAATTQVDHTRTFVQVGLMVLIYFAAAIVLWRSRRVCPTRSSGREVRRLVFVVLGSAAVLLSLYVADALLDQDAFDPIPTLATALAEAPDRLFPPALVAIDSSAYVPITPLAEFLTNAISPIFMLIVIGALWRALAKATPEVATHQRGEVLELLRRGGGTAVSYMGIWPGNTYWVDASTGACVAHRNVQGVAIAIGGPFGAPGADPVAILARFASVADEAGLVPCAYSVPAAWAERFEEIGWSQVEVAEEAVVDLATWSTTGKKWQDVRTSINRTERAGITLEWSLWPDLTVRRAEAIDALNELWVGEKPLPEMGFTLGGVAELSEPDTLICMALDEAGTLVGVTSWLPTWESGEVVGRTLDFMRRNPDSMNGVMEMMIAKAAERFREEGLQWLSLSGAPLASSANQDEADALTRVLDSVGQMLEPVYGFRSLLGFKKKFQPRFEPLIMAYPDAAQLPNIGIALTAAYLPGVKFGQLAQAFRPARPAQE